MWISFYCTPSSSRPDEACDIFEAIDRFKLVLFILNLMLTVAIVILFESFPKGTYPTLSQKYYRSKMFEPHLDIKYLLQYKEFKIYAIVCAILFTAVNVVPSVEYAFLFVEAQVDDFTFNVTYKWGPIFFIIGLVVSALILANFSQTNAAYKQFILILTIALMVSIGLGMLSFISQSAGIFAFSNIITQVVCGAMRLFLYEFITEIVFPVSPCFGLAILHSMSGLLSLLVAMLGTDIVLKDPLNIP
jgi:hypothetical protein